MRPYPWRILLVVVLAFLVTRGGAAWLIEHPEAYNTEHHQAADAAFDRGNYGIWSERFREHGDLPYRDYALEYPPGSFAVSLVPDVLGDHADYAFRYVVFALVVDALGLVAIWRLARRTGHWWGVAAWLVLIPLLGPVAHSRLDIVVAAILAWAMERAVAGRWGATGAFLGLGAVTKLIPGLLLPPSVVVAGNRRRIVVGAVLVGVLAVLPFVGNLGDLYRDVIGYHRDRPVHAESLWASLAFLLDRLGLGTTGLEFSFGAYNVTGQAADTFESLADVAALGILVDSILQSVLRVRRGDGRHLAVLCLGTMTLLTAVGRVLSPQYLVWLIALLAVGLSVAPRALRWAGIWMTVAVALTHLEYPVFFFDLMSRQAEAEALLLARNLALLASGLLAARASWRWWVDAPVGEDGDEVVPVLLGGGEGPEGEQGDEGEGGGDERTDRHDP